MDEEEIEPETTEELGTEYVDTLAPGYPRPREKNTVIEFINKAFKTKDSTKVSFMDDEEVRALRVNHSAALYARMMYSEDSIITKFFMGRSEIIAAPTMGRQGNLVNAAITTKKEFKAGLHRKENKGWFKKKEVKTE